MSRKISSTSIITSRFEWSMKPILLTLKCLGIELDSKNRSFRSIKIFILGLILLGINLFMNGCSLYNHLFQNQVIVPIAVNYIIEYVPELMIANHSDGEVLPEKSTKEDATLHYPERTDHIAFVILFSGVHLSFMITCYLTRRWADIWNSLLEINQEMELSKHFHRRIRRNSFIALLLFFLVYIIQSFDSIRYSLFYIKTGSRLACFWNCERRTFPEIGNLFFL